MSMNHWERISELFSAALALAPADRTAYLRRECTDDADLIGEIESLLDHDSRADDDILHPVRPDPRLTQLLTADGEGLLVGKTIGPCKVLRLIARGGMGSVYLAEQERPHRKVALKILGGDFWSRSARRRFEFETEILGRLHHPNIAQVYESGIHRLETGATVPFFAMEYIPGAKPITVYCDEEGFDLRARLELFGLVCDAVHHGHQKGVVHRDLKPGNILVDEQGHVKVIDFGVARSTDSDVALTTMHTEAGQVIGTLAYMSPEQAGGPCGADVPCGTGVPPVNTHGQDGRATRGPADIDTRSDVYSLGVVLYELLTGRLPYDVSRLTIHAAVRVICEQEPAKPSKLKHRGAGVSPVVGSRGVPCGTGVSSVNKLWAVFRIPRRPRGADATGGAGDSCGTGVSPVNKLRPVKGDLETLVLKALEKDRAKRYHSAAALEEDIRHYLHGEPIVARPPTRWARGLRWAGRRPALATGVLCLIIGFATLAATALSVWHLNRQPYAIQLIRDGRALALSADYAAGAVDEARLISRDGNTLHTWGGTGGAIAFAERVDRPACFGGGRVAVVGYHVREKSRYAKGLGVYDVNGDLDTPVWFRKIEKGEVLRKLVEKRGIDAEHFRSAEGLVADVFPDDDHPGEEIVAVFGQDRSQWIIRIYDLGGELLYEAWHDGTICKPRWMPGPGLLLFAAEDHHGEWDDYGESKRHEGEPRPPTGTCAPAVAFALRPSPGSIDRDDYFNSDDSLANLRAGKGPSGLAWYKWLYQEGDKSVRKSAENRFVCGPAVVGDAGKFATIVFSLDANAARALDSCVTWEIDGFGNEAPDTRVISQGYKEARASGRPLPDPEAFRLEDRMPTLK